MIILPLPVWVAIDGRSGTSFKFLANKGFEKASANVICKRIFDEFPDGLIIEPCDDDEVWVAMKDWTKMEDTNEKI